MSEVKAIFITGGGSGIGRATARLFAQRGWRVGIADVNAAGLAETIALMGGGMAQSYVMDVRDREAWVAHLDSFTTVSGGRLDVLFNNAGIGTGGPLAEADFDELDRTVAINLMGVINGARIGYAYLAKSRGCLLNTASASAIYGSSGLATYSATKFGVRALTEALDGEWHGAGVRVRDIIPGFIETPLLDGIAGRTNRSIRESVIAAGLELTSADTVAEAAWDAVHGTKVHTYVGKTAHRLAFAARWMPGSLRKRMQRGLGSEG
ncbi:SDR family oxidoreductase [Sphingomonas oligophenolica]|uniref:SDR family oxidoreductase n=1 Tax=Sphingomonas oligophenolica TaxID=301154 RepID=A0A502CB67_9SPHN|nr:SDR family oxidoreductase [Sphingomonas oligophenolica]TPG10855.1 SDR family oxidoreductase [Sphingomonas oligophenolica]